MGLTGPFVLTKKYVQLLNNIRTLETKFLNNCLKSGPKQNLSHKPDP